MTGKIAKPLTNKEYEAIAMLLGVDYLENAHVFYDARQREQMYIDPDTLEVIPGKMYKDISHRRERYVGRDD